MYFWNETGGVESPPGLNPSNTAYVTSLSFSSREGGKAILATGRSNGQVVLYSPLEDTPRFDSNQPHPVCCVSFRPNTAKRPSLRDAHIIADTEELLVGDEVGHVYFYSIEWPSASQRDIFNWPGAVTLLCRITVHTQQICGLAWSVDGESFATGGNDNLCHLFDTRRVLAESVAIKPELNPTGPTGLHLNRAVNGQSSPFNISALYARHCFEVSAAVKAIAFCP